MKDRPFGDLAYEEFEFEGSIHRDRLREALTYWVTSNYGKEEMERQLGDWVDEFIDALFALVDADPIYRAIVLWDYGIIRSPERIAHDAEEFTSEWRYDR